MSEERSEERRAPTPQALASCLRTEIAETVADPADTDDEVRHLLALSTLSSRLRVTTSP